MSKKPDTASALAGILKAKRGPELPADPVASAVMPVEPETPAPPSPAPPSAAPTVEVEKPKSARKNGRVGKYRNPSYGQFSTWLRKDTRKKVGRALEDADTGQDFSELVQELLEQWLASRT